MSKTWFITGAARGIGMATARAALAAGDNVVATGRNLDILQTAYAEHGESVLALELDVANAAQAVVAAKRAAEHFGGVDVLVNNAGYGQLGMFEQIAVGDIARQFDTNVFGTLHVTRAVLPFMRRRRSGHIFNLSSVGGMVGFEGASVYCAAKFAVEGFSESLAREVGHFGIQVTIVEPGFFRTDFLDGSSVKYGDLQIDDYAEAGVALRAGYNGHSRKQAGDPDKLAQALVLLSSVANPPLRFAAGTDALEFLSVKLGAVREELDQWKVLSSSTDIAAA
jgi:NAD(P)-dependent dehydrogenase (short-subunit alcohol dehydrogenase family)